MRACDIKRLGLGLADITFPQLNCKGAKEVVSALVWLLSLAEKDEKRRAAEKGKEEIEQQRQRFEKECAEKTAVMVCAPPENLEAQVLTGDEREAVKKACLKELNVEKWEEVAKTPLGVLLRFAKFCELLSKSENHIIVPGLVKKEVPSRTTMEMVNEMAQELGRLEPFTAYAKVNGEDEGIGQVSVRKIRMPGPPDRLALEVIEERTRVIMENTAAFYMPRAQIEREKAGTGGDRGENAGHYGEHSRLLYAPGADRTGDRSEAGGVEKGCCAAG